MNNQINFLNKAFFNFTEESYRVSANNELINNCINIWKNFKNNTLKFIEHVISDKNKYEMFLEYILNINDQTKYDITNEEIDPIIIDCYKKVKEKKDYIIREFNKFVGENQFNYLLDGITEINDTKYLVFILRLILNDEELEDTSNKLLKCLNEKRKYLEYIEKTKNAYTYWNLKEDQQLIEEFIMEKSINEIASIHKRTQNAIKCRLIKLGLIEDN